MIKHGHLPIDDPPYDSRLKSKAQNKFPWKLEKGCKDIYIEVMSIRVLFLGEIVGRPGIYAIKAGLKELKLTCHADYVVANGEGATNGFGIGRNHALQLQKLGIDLITTGEKTYYKLDMVEHIVKNSRIIRPANYPPGNPGRAFRICTINDKKAAFIVLLGNSDFPRTHLANPYHTIQNLIDKISGETRTIFLQFHASTTAEKQTMAFHINGKASAMIGTHTKVLSADARVLTGGTAMITDNGRCGSSVSVGGFEPKHELQRYITQIPNRSRECWDQLELQGVVVECDDDGKAISIETIRHKVAAPEDLDAIRSNAHHV
ncbi:MAG: TIGR00282 family metallophosphoesterase [Sphaerochaetaceae bacterium]|jgi:metallophosphoesterase (TIGR00282 family)|nr:TIGR00282 family metallophosphoesterase [Sphaerochaetaceae bacterium]MDD3670140.1 TIGR00282 family metallophosphoesterase [Sphaerochaetaceae bacterium]MDD4259596.1 TIGR00282 family metallophosphoesterase [Sphaerochaetaceae bacterium]MDD4762540.1 TIGR00282 family metallophosphoesterase [Sphaerochaetaceae bacterium]